MPVAMAASAAIDWFNFKQQQKTRVDFFLAFFGSRYHLLYPNQISCFQCTPKWRNRRLIVLNGRICARHTHTQIRTHLWSLCSVISFFSLLNWTFSFGWFALLHSKLIISTWFISNKALWCENESTFAKPLPALNVYDVLYFSRLWFKVNHFLFNLISVE